MAPKKRLVAVVDGANVAYAERSREGKPKVSNLTAMRAALDHYGLKPIIIVDAALRHEIDDLTQFESLIEKQIVRQAPAGVPADYFVLRTAEEEGGIVISNDTYREARERFSWIDGRRAPFMIVNGRIEIHRPSLDLVQDEANDGKGQAPAQT